jgi:cell wall-associated NlpC family hydrolase
MNVALKYKGMPYVFGGASPLPGFDCSGLWQYSFGQIGIKLPRTAQEQFDATLRITQDQLKPGDFVFFSGTYNAGRNITHVGLYVGNNSMFDAGDNGVGYHDLSSNYYQSHIAGYGRLTIN